jgi:hypothetical protein
VWKRHRRYAGDGIWDRVLQVLLAQADAEGKIDWTAPTSTRRTPRAPSRTQGGTSESHESA